LLKDELWIRQMKTKVEVVIIRKSQVIEETTLLDEIQRNKTKKQKIQRELEKNDGIVHIEGRIYISNNRKIQEQVLCKNHDLVDIGYPGQQRMLELIKRSYWWPGS